MLFGNYQRTLDDKNRTIIPSKLRERLGNVCYVTVGTDNILELRDEKAFSVFRDKLLSVNMLNQSARKFARLLLGRTIEIEIDKVGRIALPENFLNQTGITKKDVTFVGVGNKIEIWQTDSFVAFTNEYEGESSIEDLAKELLKNGVEL